MVGAYKEYLLNRLSGDYLILALVPPDMEDPYIFAIDPVAATPHFPYGQTVVPDH